MENITLGDVVNLVDQVQADDKKIEVSFRFQE
jgi:translation initiation factor IF-1